MSQTLATSLQLFSISRTPIRSLDGSTFTSNTSTAFTVALSDDAPPRHVRAFVLPGMGDDDHRIILGRDSLNGYTILVHDNPTLSWKPPDVTSSSSPTLLTSRSRYDL